MEKLGYMYIEYIYICIYILYCQVLPSDLFERILSDLFRGVSDLHLGDQKVTWKNLVYI